LAQQLSTKVAEMMNQRFLEIFNGREPKAHEILKVPLLQIRSIGISENKAKSIHHVAEFFIQNKLTDKKIHKMSDEEIIKLLIQIKGVGRWTAEMRLIFALAREDVFSLDDLGIQKGMQKLHRLEHLSGKELKQRMKDISEKWSPYRSYACLYLWRLSDSLKN
jgi:DNA-3-methyladenine glycosylase II